MSSQRHQWIRNTVSISFGIDEFVISTFMDKNKDQIDAFLNGTSLNRHIFFYYQIPEAFDESKGEYYDTSSQRQLFLTSGDNIRLKSRALYFLRNTPEGRSVKLDILSDNEVVFGELGPQPLESLGSLFSHVYGPMLSSESFQNEWGQCLSEQKQEFLTQFSKFSEDLSEAIQSLSSTIELEKIPSSILNLSEIQTGNWRSAAEDPDVVNKLRDLLSKWCKVTSDHLERSLDNQHTTGEDDHGPRSELTYWRKRMQKLTGIMERTKSRESRIVFSVLHAVPPDSPNARTVFATLREWKNTDILMTEAFNEAKDNVKYLTTLEKFIEPLYTGTPQTIIDNLAALMNAVKMVHTIARYYNTTERMTTLFTKITNQMIINCKRCITKDGAEDLWKRDPESLCEDLRSCLELNEVYRAQYNETKNKLHAMPKGKQFDFSEPMIFGRFDLFCRRCFKLNDMFKTIKQFKALASHNFENMKKLNEEFRAIVDKFKANQGNNNLLDFTSNRFDRNYVEFNVSINDLEAQLQRFINQSFLEIPSSEQALDLHVKFMNILERDNLRADLDSKVEQIFRKYGQEIGKVQGIYKDQFLQPQIARNLPDIAGNIMWARHLLNRIEAPMRRFLKHKSVFNISDANFIVKSYNKLARTLIEFELRWANIWRASVAAAKAGLQATLLVRSPKEDGGKLYVNFDFEVIQLIRETKCLDRLGVDVPEGAKLVLLQEKKFKEFYAELAFLLKEYRRITSMVRPVMQKILAPHFDHLEFVLRPGLTTLTWTSMNIGVYLNSVHSALSRFEQLVLTCNDFIDNRVEANFKFISRLSVFDLPSENADPQSLDQFVERQEDRVRDVTSILKEKASEVETAVDEMLVNIVSFPLDNSIDPTASDDIISLKEYFSISLYQAIRNAIRLSLHALKRRMQPIRAFHKPSIDEFTASGTRRPIGPRDRLPSPEELEAKTALEHSPDPLFEVKVSLGFDDAENAVISHSGNVSAVLSPSISEVQRNLTKASLAVLHCCKELRFWDLAVPRVVVAAQRGVDVSAVPAPVVYTENVSFYEEISADRELLKVLLLLNGAVERARSEVALHLDIFNDFVELWTVTPEDSLSRFKAERQNAPSIDDYEAELARLKAIQDRARSSKHSKAIGTLKINSEIFSSRLCDLAESRILCFAGELHKGSRADLEKLANKVKEFEKRLKKDCPQGDIEALHSIMLALHEIRKLQGEIAFEMGPLERKFGILDVFYHPPANNSGTAIGGAADRDEQDMRTVLKSSWASVLRKAEEKQDELRDVQQSFKESLIKQINSFREDVIKFKEHYDQNGPRVPGLSPKEASTRLRQFKEDLEIHQRKREVYSNGADLFGLPRQEYPELDEVHRELQWLGGLYDLYNRVEERIVGYADITFTEVSMKLDDMEREVDKFKSDREKLAKELRTYPAYRDLSKRIEDFEKVTPLLRDLIKPCMKERHWDEIKSLTGAESPLNDENYKLKSLLDANLPEKQEQIAEVTEGAEKQAKLEDIKDEAITFWSTITFSFDRWKSREQECVLVDLADILQRLEDDQMNLNAIKANRHSGPFKEQVNEWLSTLSTISDTLSRWINVQQLWTGLEAVFLGGDIAKALPSESSKFMDIDKTWLKIMSRAVDTGKVKECCLDDMLQQALPILQKNLEDCQRALDAYLETKRNRFPRFFFVSNAALVKILSQGSDPHSLQEDFEKVFDAITQVVFDKADPKKILSFKGVQGGDEETVLLSTPVKCGETVETWLKQLEVEMQTSVRRICSDAASKLGILNTASLPLNTFNSDFIAQVSLLGLQICWTQDCQEAIEKATNQQMKDKAAMNTCSAKIAGMMDALREMCLAPIPTKMKRTKVETLVTIHVHQQELFEKLNESVRRGHIKSAQDFEWLKQTRLYWKTDKNDAIISIADVDFPYKHEYLGVKERLCITALTDRCYLTNSQALGMYYGGAPSGPAGTGKTETVKDMGRTIGVFVIVTNCTEGHRYRDMGQIFKGLCQSGLWGCFDEFNRIDLEVLSVVAMQVESITQAKKQGAKTFFFPAGESEQPNKIPLVASCAYFITMNPGYAGRQELPENLKAQFRFVAMMVPDRATIIKVKLASVGFGGRDSSGGQGSNVAQLAQKFKVLYGLCEEQLSKQRHYDFGLRNILSVLRTAGGVKRDYPQDNEEMLLMRTLRDMNLSKLVAEDTRLFESLLADIFPAQKNPGNVQYKEVEERIDEVVTERSLLMHDSWRRKVIQLYETSRVRHGFMLVGRTLTGKSTILDVLTTALTRTCNGSAEYKVHKLNPKAITAKQMYGYDNAGTWVKGVFAELWKRCNDKKDRNFNWLVCDGPVDAIWIEDLNTVLDDNRILTLSNNDRIPMSDNCRIVFEVNDLDQASPATVSRAGIVFVSEGDLGWEPLLDAWLRQRELLYAKSKTANVGTTESSELRSLFNKWLKGTVEKVDENGDKYTVNEAPIFKFINRDLKTCMPISNTMMVNNVLQCLTALLRPVREEIGREPEGTVLNTEGYRNILIYSIVWGIGGLYEPEDRLKFDAFLKESMQFPNPCEDGLTFYDYGLPDRTTRQWEKWSPKEVKLGKGKLQPASILIPTVDSVRAEFILNNISGLNRCKFPVLPYYRSILVVGASGTAKSSTILMYMQNFDPETTVGKVVNFSSATTPLNLQNIVMYDSELEKTSSTLAPPDERQLSFFFDDVSMPQVGKWGEQVTLELARQLIEHQGFYSLESPGDFWKVDRLMYIGAMNHPGGGRNDVPPRFKSKFFSFNMVLPSLTSVDNIYGYMIRARFTQKNGAAAKVIELSKKLTASTIEVWDKVKRQILPTPARFHYVFNMRELSRIFTGVLCTPLECISTEEHLVSLWKHECYRVLADKLLRQQDKDVIRDVIYYAAGVHYSEKLQQSIAEPQFWCNFLRPEGEDESNLIYEKCSIDVARSAAKEKLSLYNSEPKNATRKMNLVFFDDALEHLLRITRILSTPRGSAMLVGVGGSGKQSLARLAAFICKMDCHQMVVTKNFNEIALADELRLKCRMAAVNKPVCFIVTDQEIKTENFLEYFNSLLSTGEFPNMFPKEDRESIGSEVRNEFIKQTGANSKDEIPIRVLLQFAVKQLRENLHFTLCFSPVGAKFPVRAQKFPGVFSCVTIDWYMPWPEEALIAVASSLVNRDKIKTDSESMKNLFVFMGSVQENVGKVCDLYYSRFHRHVYVTPKTFLSFLDFFQEVYVKKYAAINASERAVKEGLKKLEEAAQDVAKMGVDLQVKKEKVTQEKKETTKLLSVVEQKKTAAEKQAAEVSAKAKKTQETAEIVAKDKADAEAQLAEARPAYLAAIKAVSALKPGDIVELKALKKLAALIKIIFDGVQILLGRPMEGCKPQTFTAAGSDHSFICDSFDAFVRSTIYTTDFLSMMREFAENERDNITDETVELLEPYINLKVFNPQDAAKVSVAAGGMCAIVAALSTYQGIAKKVKPLLNNVEMQTAMLDKATREVAEAQLQVKEALDMVADLEKQLQEKQDALKSLEDEAQRLEDRMTKAENLIASLEGENQRWTQDAKTFEDRRRRLVGDVCVAAAFISYCGPFNSEFREMLRDKTFHSECLRLKVPTSDVINIIEFLSDPTTIGEWGLQGLPSDPLSIENGIMVTEAKRYPLMIDPQIQALSWIKKREAEHMSVALPESSIIGCVATMDHPRMKERLQYCIEDGKPFLIENVENEVDPSLDPVLEKQIVLRNGKPIVTLGDQQVEWNAGFRLYITSRLGNPHFSPELQAKCTVIDFTVTLAGLQQQLLGRVLTMEQRALEEALSLLIAESTESAKQLKELDAKLLDKLSNSTGVLLDDDELIATLSETKEMAMQVQMKMDEAKTRTTEIAEKRKQYLPVATRGSVLYFSMVEVQSINWMYNSSLGQFLEQFDMSILRAERAQPTSARVKKIVDKLTEMVYRYVNRGLFEKHKRTFVLMVVLKIMLTDKVIDGGDVTVLLRASGGAEPDAPNPFPKWLQNEQWANAWAISNHKFNSQQPFLRTLCDDIIQNEDVWKKWIEHNEPETQPIPTFEERLQSDEQGPLVRLCLVRALREDRTRVSTGPFIEAMVGSYFTAPVTDSIESIWEESNKRTPILYLLSPGADPTNNIDELAKKKKKFPTEKVSMGEGQEGPAMRKMTDGFQEGVGSWVVLQNCHLGLGFMATIESLLKDRAIDDEFRLWITCEENPNFPIGLLQLAIKVTNEPPMGLKAGLQRTYQTMITQETIDKVDDSKWRTVLYATAFLHSIVQERRKFGAIGWCIPYEFNNSDLEASLLFMEKHLSVVLPLQQPISWQTVTYMVAEVQYGGRVTDDLDRELFKQYSEIYLNNNIFLNSFSFNSLSSSSEHLYKIPQPTEERFGEIAFWRSFIDEFPSVDSPAAFGLHVNADLSFRRNEAALMLNTIQSTLPRDSGASGGMSRDDKVKSEAEDFLKRMPENFSEEHYRSTIAALKGPGQLKYADANGKMIQATGLVVPLNVFLLQEIQRMEKIITLVSENLVAIKSAIEGTVIMTPELQLDIDRIFDQRVPVRWTHDASGAEISWLSPSLHRWMRELYERHQQLNDWLRNGRPKCFRLASFLNPQGFLTAMKQEVTRCRSAKNEVWALDEVEYITEVTRIESKEKMNRDVPDDGSVLIHSLKIEGARYTDKLEESKPRVPIAEMPIIHVSATSTAKNKARGSDFNSGNTYFAPVYKYAARTDRYIIFRMHLKFGNDPSQGGGGNISAAAHWKLRGVALLCHAD